MENNINQNLDAIRDLTNKARKLRRTDNWAEAANHINAALQIAQEKPKATLEYGKALQMKAQLLNDNNEKEESFDFYYQAYKIFTSIADDLSAFHAMWHAAAVASDIGKHTEAKEMLRKCLALMQKIEISELHKANFFRVMAIHEDRIDNLIGAYALWMHALSIYKNLNIEEGVKESKSSIESILEKINS